MAQPQALVYVDVGQNVVSDGFFFRTAGLVNYQYGKYNIASGGQFSLISENENIFSGFEVKASRDFFSKKFPLQLLGFFVYAPFSKVIRETNWGILLNINRKHILLNIGANFRTFGFTHKAVEKNDLSSNKIHESWNAMYSFTYFVKPLENRWNIGFCFTDFDHFFISQETNPIFKLRASYKPISALNLFADYCRISAGALNTNVNYFGFFVRTGLIWNIK